MHAIVIHGGAGRWPDKFGRAALAGVRRAAKAGAEILARGGSALDAVVAAVTLMEDDPVFNSGTGSVLNSAGEAEMDACVMVSKGLRAGGVACLQRVKNPLQVARKVLEKTSHVLLAGAGAQQFARRMGFDDYDPVTDERRREYQKIRTNPKRYAQATGNTVGAVALDEKGVFAAATSTGGLTLKLPGRVGDTPLPGAGTYANRFGAASATGLGEAVMRILSTKSVCDYLAVGMTAEEAVRLELVRMSREFRAEMGFIALDRNGRPGIVHSSPAMPHAYYISGKAKVVVKMQAQR
ncbi:MAG: isoaspartyl peptidase/L-asparaginase family protein [Burkholderiales bacterium]